MFRKLVGSVIVGAMLAGGLAPSAAHAAPIQNVILFIGDGMGAGHVEAAGLYANGAAGTLSFESFPHQGFLSTANAGGGVPDSAAAATAMATGVKVNDGVISKATPGDGHDLQTLLEYFGAGGKSTGLVTTSYLTDATPAAFGAHRSTRGDTSGIASDYLTRTRPNILFGGGGSGLSAASAEDAGYTVVTHRADMLALDTATVTLACGQFGSGNMPYEYDGNYATLPHLAEMTTTALDILDDDPDGFFLMVEGGMLDHAAHDHNLQRVIFETLEFSEAVQEAIDWADGRTDTLILVTADHETGGLAVAPGTGKGEWPIVTWSSGGHTSANVPVYAWGPNSEMISGVMENTAVFTVATAPVPVPEPATLALLGLGGAAALLRRRRGK